MVSKIERRIVSLVPSLSETVAAMGLSDELVGKTSFCVYPRGLKAAIIGGTKNINLDAVRSLQPSHILAVKEENTKDQVTALAADYPTIVLDPSSLEDVADMLTALHTFVDLRHSPLDPKDLSARIKAGSKQAKRRKALYLIWHEPAMAAGCGTYIDSCLKWLGYDNVITTPRYPRVCYSDFYGSDIDILLSSEPFAFRKRQAETIRSIVGARPRIRKIDGKTMSWYGATTFTFLSTPLEQLVTEFV